MKRFLRAWVCGALALCLLVGCAPVGPTWAEAVDSGGAPVATVAYIPLDDRPVNTVRVELLAASAGMELLMPEEHLYRTALDGRPNNPNGTSFGDGEALLSWLEGCVADYYVISVDQLLSGGLVNSRWLGDTDISAETGRIDRLLTALAGKRVILYDTVMRLAPTVGYGGYGMEEYTALRAYGAQPRPKIEGELSAQAVMAGYAVPTELDEDLVERYLAARRRKLRLTDYLLTALATRPEVVLYYGVDDSSPERTIQTNEIVFIEQRLGDGHIFAGTDEMGLLSVARAIREHYGDFPAPQVRVRYFGVDPTAPADRYDIGSLEDNMAAHLGALEACSKAEDPDIEVLVMGQGTSAAEALLAQYQENLRRHIPSVVVDLGPLFDLPATMAGEEELDLSGLLSYSRWNTAGNSIGIALSYGLARYLYLKYQETPVADAHAAHIGGLALSFATDVAYAGAKPAIEDYILTRGADPEQITLEGDAREELLDLALRQMMEQDGLLERLSGNRFLISLAPWAAADVPEVSLARVQFPWERTYEARITVRVRTEKK